MCCTGTLEHLSIILLDRIIAGDRRCQRGHQQQREHHRRTDGGQTIPPQFPCRIGEDAPAMSMRLRQARLGALVKLPGWGDTSLCHEVLLLPYYARRMRGFSRRYVRSTTRFTSTKAVDRINTAACTM